MTFDCDRNDFIIKSNNLWKGEKLYSLYARAATPYEWFPELFSFARGCGITPFASPFSPAGIELLERLEAPAYKIASFEAVDLELIAQCAKTGKPVIVSTGLCCLDEISDILDTFYRAGGTDIALLRCNSAYPADPREANLATIPDMIARFNVPIGYSDHTTTPLQAALAVGLGACIIEKHVIDAREPETADSSFSCLPEDLNQLVTICRAAWQARGSISYGPHSREQQSLVFRRSLYACADITTGEAFTRQNIRCIRPGFGLPPKHLSKLLGMRSSRQINRGEPIAWDMIEQLNEQD